MSKFSDILYMIAGIVLLILSSTGAMQLGIVGFACAGACIAYGLQTMYKMRLAGKAMESDFLQDKRVVDFYHTTRDVWSQGRLAWASKRFEKEGRVSYEKFVEKHRPIEGSGLHVLFSQFPPQEGEYLVGVGDSDSSKNSGWFVLTDRRLIQRDGRDDSFKEILLAEIDTIESTGRWTRKMVFQLVSGRTVDFEKVLLYPSEEVLGEMIRQQTAAA